MDAFLYRSNQFSLVNPATHEMVIALSEFSNQRASVEETLRLVEDCIRHGADPSPPYGTYNLDPLLEMAQIANQNAKSWRATRELITRMAESADKRSLDLAFGYAATRILKKHTAELGAMLHATGAGFSPDAKTISFLANTLNIVSDEQAEKVISNLVVLGWTPAGVREESYVMDAIIQRRMLRGMDAWIKSYEQADVVIPMMHCGNSPIHFLREREIYAKRVPSKECIREMTRRIAISGLAPVVNGISGMNAQSGAADWLIEAGRDGENNRLNRNTRALSAPPVRRSPRL